MRQLGVAMNQFAMGQVFCWSAVSCAWGSLLYRSKHRGSDSPVRQGCVSFFCTQEGGRRIGEKQPGERGGHESQEEQAGAESPDAASERRTARRAGDDAMEERAPEGDVGRD